MVHAHFSVLFAISYSDLSDTAQDDIVIIEAASAFDALAKHPKTTDYTKGYDRNDPNDVKHLLLDAYDDEIVIIVKPVTLPGNNQA